MSLLKKSTPPWINFIVDVIICICSIILAYLLRFNFQIPSIEKTRLPYILFFVIAVRGTSFLIGNTYRGIYRYTTTRDGQKILYVISAGSLFFMLSNGLKYYFIDNHFIIPFSIVIIDFFTSTFSLVSLRLLIKIMYLEYETPERKQADVLIFGAGESGIVTKKVLDRDAGIKYRVIAFIDDNKTLTGKKVDDILICHSSELESVLKSNTIHHMIISVQSISAHRKKELIEICLAYNTKVFSVPPVNTWINGELSFKQIKKVRIEDLLEREEIKLDEEEIRKQVLGKRILVTGAAGSIGSEIIRQLIKYNPEKIILFDIAESPLFFLELEMHENLKTKNFEPIIGDIRNKQQLEYIFQKYRPEIVYHAAAYKHVPM
ncbi:MAG: polysaccharide biosynthesis protein, partial [Bacteroidota bacterium]|nr:polysaccharide biosynthesis protein [Bacteroidota bacterium]